MYFCGLCFLSCIIFYKINLVMASDQVYIPIMKPIPVSAEKPDDVPNLFDGDPETSYELFLRPPSFLTLVLDLGGTIPFNTLELSELLCFQLELDKVYIFFRAG